LNREKHIVFGLIGFVAYVILLQNIRPFEIDILVFGGVASILGSIIPDLIEPAGDFRHRGFAHSKRVLSRFTIILLITSLISLFIPVLLVISAGLIGYILHLLADSTTRTNIPE